MSQLIYDVDYFVRMIPLPWHIGGASVVNEDGTYSIYLNSRHGLSRQRGALLHEVAHCQEGHLDSRKDLPPSIKEWEADHADVHIRWCS